MMTNLKILFMFLFLSVVAFGVTSSHMIIDTGSTTAVTGNVTAVQGTGSNLHVVVDTAPSTAVTGPLTDTQLRASAVPISVASVPSHAVTNAGTFAVQATGTFYQATQPVSLASAQVASGAFASGSIASGAIASGAIASGAVASGAIASGAVASGAFASGSIVAGAIAAGATSFVKLEDAASADGDAGVPAFAVRKATPANTSGSDGDYEALQISAGRLWTSTTIDTALPAGSAVIGHVIADSGSTTAVTQATGTNLHAVLDTTSTTACTQATGTNLHTVVDSAPTTAVTIASLPSGAVTNAGTFATQSKLVDTAGTNQGTIKAASTLSVATDTSLVVVQTPGGGNPCQNPSSVLVGISGATSTNNATQIIGLSGTTKIYICSMTITGVSGTTPTFSLVTGTGSNCVTGQATLVGAWTTAANTLYQFSYMVGISPAGAEVCYKDGGTSPVQNYTVTYVQQ